LKPPSALVLSHDPVAVALISSAAEVAGLEPLYLADCDRARDALRRLRPATVVADCTLDINTDAFVGPAMMTGARVAVFCSSTDAAAAARSRQLAERYDVAFFLLPEDTDALHAYLHEVARSSRDVTGS
jgi:hypothetical protein